VKGSVVAWDVVVVGLAGVVELGVLAGEVVVLGLEVSFEGPVPLAGLGGVW
jgi:hypothetical protein